MKKYLLVFVVIATLVSCKKDCGVNTPGTTTLQKGLYIVRNDQGSVVYTPDMKTFTQMSYQMPSLGQMEAYATGGTINLFGNSQIFGDGTLFTSRDVNHWSVQPASSNSPWRPYVTQSIIPFKGGWIGLIPGIHGYKSADAITWQTTSVSSAMESRNWETYYTKNDTVFMYGGYHHDPVADTYTALKDLWMTKDGIVWQELPVQVPGGVTIEDFAFTSLNGKSYAFGSKNRTGVSEGSRFLSSTDGYTWTEVEDASPVWASIEGTRYNQILFVFNSHLYLMGGTATEAGSQYQDIWSYDGSVWKKEFNSLPILSGQINRQQIVVVN